MTELPSLQEQTRLDTTQVTAGSPTLSKTITEVDLPADETQTDATMHESEFAMESQEIFQPRPSTPRRATEPYSSSLLNPLGAPRQRNRSPYARAHLRSHSSSTLGTAPPMTRAHSLPTAIYGISQLTLTRSPSSPMVRPASPLRSPARSRSPFRLEDSYSSTGAPSVCDISEDSELELTPKPMPSDRSLPSSPTANSQMSNTFPRRRRPASPLHQVSSSNGTLFGTPVSSNNSSPLLTATRFNEPFPNGFPASLSSSVPSTPTSTRSRSPSISSLETIPDSPDAEAEAVEEDRRAKLRAAEDGPRRSSMDEPTRRISFTNRDKRKRWSVCGGERRQDLDLETIYED